MPSVIWRTSKHFQIFLPLMYSFGVCVFVSEKTVYQVRIFINSFSAGDIILRLWNRSCHYFIAGHIIFHNNQVPYVLSQHNDRAWRYNKGRRCWSFPGAKVPAKLPHIFLSAWHWAVTAGYSFRLDWATGLSFHSNMCWISEKFS